MHGCARTITLALIGTGLWMGPACVAQKDGTEAPRSAPAADFKTADELLDALETADRDLVSLTAGVIFDKTFELQGDRQVRRGRLWFVSEPGTGASDPPHRKFAVHFERVWIGEVRRDEDKTYIFDGQWLMEKDGAEKFFQKKQVVGPGEHFDPLKVGQGPFVLPIGQRKADITARYTTELLPATAGLEPGPDASDEDKKAMEEARKNVADSWQLKLVPRAGLTEEEEFSEIRLWYKRGAHGELLPRMARTVKPPGDVATVVLINVEVQLSGKPANKEAAVDPAVFDVTAPEGWNGQVMPWRKRGEAGVGEPPDAGDK